MSTLTPELWAEIAQHLRASSVIRHGMILEDMERGMDAEQTASRQRITRDTARSYMKRRRSASFTASSALAWVR